MASSAVDLTQPLIEINTLSDDKSRPNVAPTASASIILIEEIPVPDTKQKPDTRISIEMKDEVTFDGDVNFKPITAYKTFLTKSSLDKLKEKDPKDLTLFEKYKLLSALIKILKQGINLRKVPIYLISSAVILLVLNYINNNIIAHDDFKHEVDNKLNLDIQNWNYTLNTQYTDTALSLLETKLNSTVQPIIQNVYRYWCTAVSPLQFTTSCEAMFWCLTGNYFTPAISNLPCSWGSGSRDRVQVTPGDSRFPFPGDAYYAPYANCCWNCENPISPNDYWVGISAAGDCMPEIKQYNEAKTNINNFLEEKEHLNFLVNNSTSDYSHFYDWIGSEEIFWGLCFGLGIGTPSTFIIFSLLNIWNSLLIPCSAERKCIPDVSLEDRDFLLTVGPKVSLAFQPQLSYPKSLKTLSIYAEDTKKLLLEKKAERDAFFNLSEKTKITHW